MKVEGKKRLGSAITSKRPQEPLKGKTQGGNFSDETHQRKKSAKDLSNSKSFKTTQSHAMTKADSEEFERAQDFGLQQAQILAYYRNRADAFDADRQSLYSKLDRIRLKQEIVHRAEWECRKRLEERA